MCKERMISSVSQAELENEAAWEQYFDRELSGEYVYDPNKWEYDYKEGRLEQGRVVMYQVTRGPDGNKLCQKI
jgi:hypothetical protein